MGAPEPALSLSKVLAFETWDTTDPNHNLIQPKVE